MKSDPWWTHVTTLYYSGNYTQALSVLKQRCADLCDNPVESALQLHTSLSRSINDINDTLYIISETLYLCGGYSTALQIYEHMNDNIITDERERIADCQHGLGDNDKAIEILSSITDKSASVYFSLGNAYCDKSGQHEKAEQCYLRALQIEYNKTSAEPRTDYYGNLLTTDCDIQDKVHVDIMSAGSPKDRLTMIKHITPDIILYIGSLGNVYQIQKKHSIAEVYYREALQFIDDLYGKGAVVQATAHTLSNLASNYNQNDNYNEMERYKKAEEYYLKALDMYKKTLQGAVSVKMANTLGNLAGNYKLMREDDKAMEYFKQEWEMRFQIGFTSH